MDNCYICGKPIINVIHSSTLLIKSENILEKIDVSEIYCDNIDCIAYKTKIETRVSIREERMK